MKLKNSVLATVVASLGFASTAFAADGTINFIGTITDTACQVTTANASQNVTLGTVSAKAFTAAGDTAAATKFTIKVSSCPDTVTSASIRFDGEPTQANNQILALTAGQTATNVGVGIYENDSSTLIGLQKDSAPQTLAKGDNDLTFVAKYYATAAGVTAGSANASTTFTITYK